MGHFSVILCINLLIHILCAVHGLLYQNVYHFIRITAGNSASLCFSEVHTALKAITLVSGFVVGGGGACKTYFAGFLHFQRLILRIECCFKLNCSTSFLARPFFFVVCLLFCQFIFYFQLSNFISACPFLWNSVALEDVCWLFFSLSSLLLVLALICHAVLSLSPHSADLC